LSTVVCVTLEYVCFGSNYNDMLVLTSEQSWILPWKYGRVSFTSAPVGISSSTRKSNHHTELCG